MNKTYSLFRLFTIVMALTITAAYAAEPQTEKTNETQLLDRINEQTEEIYTYLGPTWTWASRVGKFISHWDQEYNAPIASIAGIGAFGATLAWKTGLLKKCTTALSNAIFNIVSNIFKAPSLIILPTLTAAGVYYYLWHHSPQAYLKSVADSLVQVSKTLRHDLFFVGAIDATNRIGYLQTHFNGHTQKAINHYQELSDQLIETQQTLNKDVVGKTKNDQLLQHCAALQTTLNELLVIMANKQTQLSIILTRENKIATAQRTGKVKVNINE